jgi:hypothetical protein
MVGSKEDGVVKANSTEDESQMVEVPLRYKRLWTLS